MDIGEHSAAASYHQKFVQNRSACPWTSALLSLSFYPLLQTILTGQDALLVVLAATISALLLQTGRDMEAGFVLGLAAFRFECLILPALLLAFWGRWRWLSGFVMSATVVALISVAVTGLSGTVDYLHFIFGLVGGGYQFQPVWRMVNLRGLLVAFGLKDSVVIAISLAALGLVAVLGRKRSAIEQLLIAISLAGLASYHFYIYDLAIVLPAWFFLISKARGFCTLAALTGALFIPQLILFFGADRYHWMALVEVMLWASWVLTKTKYSHQESSAKGSMALQELAKGITAG